MSQSTDDKPYRFWLPLTLDLLKFLAEASIAVGICFFGYQLSQQEARPKLEQLGEPPQFPANDNNMTVRFKNYSTRQDAVITRIEYIVNDRAFLDCIEKRRPYVKNSPPAIGIEHIISDKSDIQLTHCDWDYNGTAFIFTQDVDIAIQPGKAEALRLCIGSPSWNKNEWKGRGLQGDSSFTTITTQLLSQRSTYFRRNFRAWERYRRVGESSRNVFAVATG